MYTGQDEPIKTDTRKPLVAFSILRFPCFRFCTISETSPAEKFELYIFFGLDYLEFQEKQRLLTLMLYLLCTIITYNYNINIVYK